MESASGTGNGRRTTEFTIANSAVLAAMQTERVRITVSANPLARHIERAAYFKSRKSTSMICLPRRGDPNHPQPGRTAPCHSVRIGNGKVPLIKAQQPRARAATPGMPQIIHGRRQFLARGRVNVWCCFGSGSSRHAHLKGVLRTGGCSTPIFLYEQIRADVKKSRQPLGLCLANGTLAMKHL